jgi:hypothetical protein
MGTDKVKFVLVLPEATLTGSDHVSMRNRKFTKKYSKNEQLMNKTLKDL